MSTTANGRPRKSLADQIDRLDATLVQFDRLLDGLAEALQSTVADAVVGAVRAAVQATVQEFAAQSAALALPAPPEMPKAGRVWDAARGAARRCAAAARSAAAVVCGGLGHVARLWVARRQVAWALACGMAMAAVGYLAAPWLTAMVGGFGGACAALAAQARRPVARLLDALAPD